VDNRIAANRNPRKLHLTKATVSGLFSLGATVSGLFSLAIVTEALVEVRDVEFVIDEVVQGAFEGPWQQLPGEVDGERSRASVDVLVAGHDEGLSLVVGATRKINSDGASSRSCRS